jgi:hypothetical protein
MSDDRTDEAKAAQIERNIELAFAFAQEIVDDPARLEQLPVEATVFVAPIDDQALVREQGGRALEAAKTTRNTYLWLLGAVEGERAARHVRFFTPRWPTRDIEPAAVYDRPSDTLIVDFFHGRRRGIAIPSEAFGLLIVDEQTEEVVANILPQFLSRLVRRDYTLIDGLLRPETDLHGITREEAVSLRDALRREAAAPAAPPAAFPDLIAHMEHLQPLTA